MRDPADDGPIPIDEVLAELRREMGEDAVVVPALQSRHLPEGRFRWLTARSGAVTPRESPPRAPSSRLIRRLYSPPIPLAADSRRLVEAWLLHRVDQRSHIEHLAGPYVIAGGWWTGKPVRRDYYYAKDRSGAVWWVYRDRVRRWWYLQGTVE